MLNKMEYFFFLITELVRANLYKESLRGAQSRVAIYLWWSEISQRNPQECLLECYYQEMLVKSGSLLTVIFILEGWFWTVVVT